MNAVHLAVDHLPHYAASSGWLTPQELLLLCVVTLGTGGAIKLGPLVIQGPKRTRRRRRSRKRR